MYKCSSDYDGSGTGSCGTQQCSCMILQCTEFMGRECRRDVVELSVEIQLVQLKANHKGS